MPYNLPAIRQLVHVAFSAEELETFCADFFPAVEAEFTTGQSQSQRVAMLVSYVERQGQLDLLLAWVKEKNPHQYSLYEQRPAVAMPDVRPYRGLEAFTEDESHARYYFGREETTDQLLHWLDGHNFVALVGASGSGKSSLARAGLAYKLKGGALPGQKWAIEFFRPGEDPLRALSLSLSVLMEPGRSRWDHAREACRYAADLREGKVGSEDLALALQSASPVPTRHLLVADQFEELFTLCRDEVARDVFVRLLVGLPRDRWLNVLLTLRADFFGRVLRTPGLAERASAGQFNLLPMTRDGLRTAIDGPARAAGRAFEPGLVDQILQAVEHAPGQLPLLQFALGLLWDGQTADGVLTHEAYTAVGGVEGAIARRAEQVYVGLTLVEQAAARGLFTRLVRVAQPDEGLDDTRRRVALDGLTEGERMLARTLAGQDHRLVVTDRDPSTDRETVEVAHEAIIRGWARLRGWLNEDREFLLWRQRLAGYLEGWDRTGREDAGTLLAGGLLAEAERWLAGREGWSGAERAYVEASIARREAQETLRQEEEERLRAALATAERNARVARSRELATYALEELDRQEDPSGSLALLLAREAVITTLELDEPVEPTAQDALRQAADRAPLVHLSLKGHAGPVRSAAFSPDGRWIVTASDDCTARVWDAASGAELRQLVGHTDWVWSAAFSPDGRWIVTASDDCTARVWDAASGAELHQLVGHTDRVNAAAFSPDGRWIITTGADGTVRLWDAARTAEVRQLRGHTDWVHSAAFSPDGLWIVTASSDHTVRVWEIANGVEVRQLRGHSEVVRSAVFSPDGHWIITASSDGTVRVWNAAYGVEMGCVGRHRRSVNSATFSPDGRWVATCGEEPIVRIWAFMSSSTPRQLVGHTSAVRSAAFSPDGRRILTASEDRTARLWDFVTGQELCRLEGHTDFVDWAAFGPDGLLVVTTSLDGTTRLWDVVGGQELCQLAGYRAAFSPDGRWIVTVTGDHTIRLWDVVSGEDLRQLAGHTSEVRSVVFSPDGRWIVTASDDQTARVWDAASGQEMHQLQGHTRHLLAAEFSPDSRLVVTASMDGTARLWDAASGQMLHQLRGHTGGVDSAAFSPDSAVVVTASMDGTARLWDAASGQMLRQLRGHTQWVRSAAFSPDGRRIVTASNDRTARVWDTASGAELRQLVGHTQWVGSAAFSPDGRWIVTASDEHTARVWLAAFEDLLAEAARLIQRDPPIFTDEERRRFLHEG